MSKLLSICIPTYNRAKFLRNSLESLFQQIDDSNQHQLEVIVSNNCSIDGTHELVQEYMDKGLLITYFNNAENIGSDANFVQCINKATGKYVLLLGDDDLLLDGAVSSLLSVLRKEKYGIAYISGVPYSKRARRITDISTVCGSSVVYADANEFLQHLSIYITFMSGNVFNKSLLPEFDIDQYRSSHLIQVPFYLYAVLNAKKNVVIKEPLLATGGNGDNNGGYGLYQVFGVNLFDILTEFKQHGVGTATIRKIANDALFDFFPYFTMVARRKGNFKTESNDVMDKYHRDNCRYRYLIRPLQRLPLPLAYIYFFGYRCLRKIMHVLGEN